MHPLNGVNQGTFGDFEWHVALCGRFATAELLATLTIIDCHLTSTSSSLNFYMKIMYCLLSLWRMNFHFIIS